MPSTAAVQRPRGYPLQATAGVVQVSRSVRQASGRLRQASWRSR